MEQKTIKLRMDPPLLGFEEMDTYTLRPVPENPYFFWLEAENGPQFLLTRPEYFFSDYLQQVKQYLMPNTAYVEKSLDVFVIVTLKDKVQDMTANLMAPLLLDFETRQAGQYILYDSPYTPRHRLFPPQKRCNCG